MKKKIIGSLLIVLLISATACGKENQKIDENVTNITINKQETETAKMTESTTVVKTTENTTTMQGTESVKTTENFLHSETQATQQVTQQEEQQATQEETQQEEQQVMQQATQQEEQQATQEEIQQSTQEEILITTQPQTEREEQSVDTNNMNIQIGNTTLTATLEDNASAEALKDLIRDGGLTIEFSMYGGFEQVGAIGTSLPTNDVQTNASAGDIMLYQGNKMVMFYGNNSWSYTRLGRINASASELEGILGNKDVTATFSLAQN